MAFLNRVGNLLKQTASKHGNVELAASNSSLFGALRSMSSSSKLFVGGLSYGTDDMGLKDVFSKYGDVVEARVVVDRDTGRSKGFGFVTYATTEAASSAIQAFDGQELHGRRVRVNYAIEKPRGGGFGGGYGSGGGYNYGGQDGGNYGGRGYQGGGYGGYGGGNQYPPGGGGNYSGGDSVQGSGYGASGGDGFGSGNQYSGGGGSKDSGFDAVQGVGSFEGLFDEETKGSSAFRKSQEPHDIEINEDSGEDESDGDEKDDKDEPNDYANTRG